MMLDPTLDLSPPPLSKLLGLIPPGYDFSQQESLRLAVNAAIDCNVFQDGECNDAYTALIDASRFSTVCEQNDRSRTVRLSRFSVHWKARHLLSGIGLANLAGPALPSSFTFSEFHKCLGGLPAEVRLRADCAATRPRLGSILTASAIGHLVESVFWLAARIPGAQPTSSGDIEWFYDAPQEERASALAWTRMDGPGLFVEHAGETNHGF